MKVLLLNGSPNVNGNTARALEEMRKIFEEENIETEVLQIGSQEIRGCCACQSCYKTRGGELINICKRKILHIMLHIVSEIFCKSRTCLCGSGTRGNTAQKAERTKNNKHKAHFNNIGCIAHIYAVIDELAHNFRNKDLENNLNRYKYGRKY